MKRFTALIFAAALLLSVGTLSGAVNDPVYHTVEEITEECFALQAEYPDWVRVDTIGYSQAEGLPIYCLRITKDVHEPPGSKPPVVINGQIHSEEIIGIELVFWLARKMVSNNVQSRKWRERVDLYLIPTQNPEGLNVTYQLDNSYRKNKRDNIGDGLFRYLPGWGGDTSGVDLNRNYPFSWWNGDPFLVGGSQELYDYYRGPAPASESETRALMDLIDRVRPLYSCTIHSSRTGNVAEQVIYPWAFDERNPDNPKKPPADYEALKEMALQVANRCNKYGLKKPYKTVAISAPGGDSDLYYYVKHGTFGFRIEVGAKGEGMQPDSAGLYEVINDTRLGFEYLLNSAANEASDESGQPIARSRFDIYVTDAADKSPLSARIALKNWVTPMFPYRTTNPISGRYFWQTISGTRDTLIISKFGYEQIRRLVSAGDNPVRVGGSAGTPMTKLPVYNAEVKLFTTAGLPLTSRVEMNVTHRDSVWDTDVVNGAKVLPLPKGYYTLTFYTGNSFVPRRVTVELASDTTWNISLSPGTLLLNQDFEGADIAYTTDNDININGNAGDSLARWEVTDGISHSGLRCLTDSKLTKVLRSEDGWCAPYDVLNKSFDLSNQSTAAIVYWLNQDLEPGYDSMWVEVWTPDSGWTPVAPGHWNYAELENVPIREWNAPSINLMQFNKWERFIIPLDDWCGKEKVLHFRFRLTSDELNTTDGVWIDDIQFFASASAPPAVTSLPVVPREFNIEELYPNPFNGRLNLKVTLPVDGAVSYTLTDINGRQVSSKQLGSYVAGVHQFTISADTLPTGLYFLHVKSGGKAIVRKVMLLK